MLDDKLGALHSMLPPQGALPRRAEGRDFDVALDEKDGVVAAVEHEEAVGGGSGEEGGKGDDGGDDAHVWLSCKVVAMLRTGVGVGSGSCRRRRWMDRLWVREKCTAVRTRGLYIRL